MNRLDTNALLKAVGIGVGGILVLTLLSQIPLVGIACCCLVYLGYVGAGALYGLFAVRNGAAADAGSFALGGGITGAAAGLVGGIVSALVALIFTSAATITSSLQQLEQLGYDVPPEVYDLYSSGGGTGLMALGGVLGVCIGMIIAAALGAIGGAIYAAMARNRGTPAV